jgi:hypothetical protein
MLGLMRCHTNRAGGQESVRQTIGQKAGATRKRNAAKHRAAIGEAALTLRRHREEGSSNQDAPGHRKKGRGNARRKKEEVALT